VTAEDLHVIGATTDGKLWHTLRFGRPTGPLWQPFGDVKRDGGAGDVGAFVDVDCAREFTNDVQDPQGFLHVVGVTGDGRLWYTVRHAVTHGWTPFRDRELSAGGPGPFLRAAVTTAHQVDQQGPSDFLTVAGVTADGGLWATTRRSEGEFHPFKQIAAPAGRDPTFRAVALAAVPSEAVWTHLAAVSGDGHLWYTAGQPGQWPPLQDVEETPAGKKPGDLTDVACSDDLDLGAVSGDGHVWHTTRDGGWTPFIDPEAAKDVGTFMRIGVAGLPSGLHLCGVTSDGKLWHTLHPGAPGAKFGDVKKVINPPPAVGSFQAVACA
jgi:hypothetical protein